ncbi:MAG: IS1634 family transposase [Hungateiclostridium thermocellum]|nr:IS1634 family transposase [Acetivibrio thermocellus]
MQMKLNYDKKSKDPTYFIQVGIRNGKKVTTKNIARIGKHSELLKITDDPLAYAKEQVAKYNEEAKKNNKVGMEIHLDFAQKIKATDAAVSASTLKNAGYLYLQRLYYQLEIDKFFNNITKNRKITFDPDLVNRFMTYSRILAPDSKLGSFEKLNTFYEEPVFDYQHIMRTMDLMHEHYNEYIEHLFKASGKIHKRNTAVCYYDCTNFYCEAESQDPDYVDEVTGEVFTGLRQFGYSKDHKPNPLVEMGLFMDTNGIPISMCITPGNTNEQKTVIPLEKELVKMFGDGKKKFIYCADAGLSSYHIRNYNSMGGRSFVVTQSVKKLSDALKQAVFNDCDYRLLSDDSPVSIEEMKTFDKKYEKNRLLYNDKAYKIIEANPLLDVGLHEEKVLNNGKTKKVKSKATLKQRVIITFSRKSMEYQRFIRNCQIERAKKILKEMNPDEYKKGPNDVTRFIKKVKNSKDKYELDLDKIREEEKYDGFYAIATNLEDNVKDILSINEQRYKIEDCFRILKTDFASRPYFHHTRERIIAHFMICYTALLIFRLLEVKLNNFDKSMHFTARNIIETLQNMQVANISDICYAAQYTSSRTLSALEGVFALGLDKQYYLPKELNKKCRKIF